jgi:hypothetical protein
LPADLVESSANRINSLGQAIGNGKHKNGTYSAFLFDHERVRELVGQNPRDTYRAEDIHDSGVLLCSVSNSKEKDFPKKLSRPFLLVPKSLSGQQWWTDSEAAPRENAPSTTVLDWSNTPALEPLKEIKLSPEAAAKYDAVEVGPLPPQLFLSIA